MRHGFVMGNWKMNGSLEMVRDLLAYLVENISDGSSCVLFPPALYLAETERLLSASNIKFGGQNIYPRDAGAYTGELSASMMKDLKCSHILVGHSERRNIFGESEKFIAEKFHHVKEHDMIPVLCIGESLAEREQGLTEKVLSKQLTAVIEQQSGEVFKDCVVAYEPVWAIGTGKTASPEQAQATHAFIREFVAQYDKDSADRLSILYGGSVNAGNARDLFAMPDIDGGLVGGASLDARQFVEIVECIK